MPSTLPRFALDRTLAAPPGEFELRDGTPVRVRPIRPEDRERLQVGLHQLSAASRYHRFHATVSELSRCIRLPLEPRIAEVAVTVLDAYQGRGLGTLLLGVLSPAAAAQGIRTYRAYVLEDNEAMLRIFRDLGAHVGCLEEGVYQLDIPVPEDAETLPDTPTGRVFKAVATRGGALATTPRSPAAP